MLGALAIAMAMAFLLYFPALRGGFVSDDLRFIADNAKNLDLLDQAPWRFFTDKDTIATPPDRDIYRPLRTLSFALDRRLAAVIGAPASTVLHVHNVVLHALVAFLLFLLLMEIPATKKGAAFGALFFLAHPLATEAVAWISSRSDLHAGIAVLLALLAARRAESGGSVFVVFLLAILCGFAKETAVVVPLLYLVLHRASTGRFDRVAVKPLLAMGLGCLVYLAVYLVVRDRGIQGQIDWYGGTFASHLPFALVGLARQVRLLVWPNPLNFMYEPLLFTSGDRVDSHAVVLAVVTLVAAIVSAFLLRSRVRGYVAGWVFFAIAIFPASNLVLPLRTVLAERFAYVPLVGAALAVAALAAWATSGSSDRTSALRRVLGFVGVAGLLALALLTHARARDFSSSEALYRATVRDWPESYSGALGLGGILLDEGQFGPARQELARAVALAKDDRSLRLKASFALGRAEGIAGDYPAAIATLSPLVSEFDADPQLSTTLSDLEGDIRFQLGSSLALAHRLDEAAIVYAELVRRCGATAERLDACAEVERARIGDVKKILDLYLRAIDADPEYAKARIHLAQMYHEFPTMKAEAIRQLREVTSRASSSDADRARAKSLIEAYQREK